LILTAVPKSITSRLMKKFGTITSVLITYDTVNLTDDVN
jgi:hypothetical protein